MAPRARTPVPPQPRPPTGRIVAEWEPGVGERELGGPLVVDGYGINGLGAYQVTLRRHDGARGVRPGRRRALAVRRLPRRRRAWSLGPELDYLTWAYLRPGVTATDEQAAAVNALAWRYTGAVRRGGGTVWQGDELEVRVLGVGRLTAIETTIAALHAEATARRGPWALTDLAVVGGVGVGPARRDPAARSPASRSRSRTAPAGRPTRVDRTPAGTATVEVPPGATEVAASASAPGPAVALVAPGSQRLATPGPPITVTAVVAVPPPPTTTTSRRRRRPPPRRRPTTTTTTTLPTTTTEAHDDHDRAHDDHVDDVRRPPPTTPARRPPRRRAPRRRRRRCRAPARPTRASARLGRLAVRRRRARRARRLASADAVDAQRLRAARRRRRR